MISLYRYHKDRFEGPVCDLNWLTDIKCESITNCSECVATFPPYRTADPVSPEIL